MVNTPVLYTGALFSSACCNLFQISNYGIAGHYEPHYDYDVVSRKCLNEPHCDYDVVSGQCEIEGIVK